MAAIFAIASPANIGPAAVTTSSRTGQWSGNYPSHRRRSLRFSPCTGVKTTLQLLRAGRQLQQKDRSRQLADKPMPERVLPPHVYQVVPPKQQTIRVLGQNGFPEKATLPPLCVQFPKANRSNRFEEKESKALPAAQGRSVIQSANYPSQLETRIRAIES